MMVQAILELPTSLTAAVYCTWLDLKSLCRLDSAVCGKNNRIAFLEVLKSVECVGSFQACNNEQLVWMNKRSLKSSDFHCIDEFAEDECLAFLQRSGPCISAVNQFSRTASLQMIVQFCPNLEKYSSSVGCSKWSSSQLLGRNPTLADPAHCVLPTLEYICLAEPVGDEALSILARATSKLIYLELATSTVSSAGLIEAARSIPTLRFLEVPDLHDIDYTLQQIMPLCIYLEHICLTCCEHVTDVGIATIAESAVALRTIQVAFSPAITNDCLLSLAQHQHGSLEVFIIEESCGWHSFDNMEKLGMDRTKFDQKAVSAFRNQCPKLCEFDWRRDIDFSSEDDFEEIISCLNGSDRITTLFLFYVNDTIVHTVASQCTQLKVLYFVGTTEVCSDIMLLEMVAKCAQLTTIVVEDSLQRARLKHLYVAYPRLIFLEKNSQRFQYSLDALYQSSQS